MTRNPLAPAFAILAALLASTAAAQEDALIQDGDTIVFFGDSITQAGDYIDHFEAALLSRFPEATFHIYDRGISSETISGTSEPDHDPQRPWAHERFTRDIVPLKPNVVIACFGMNDGNYHSFDWARFEKYQQGIRRLIQRVKEEAKARQLIILTPPPYDPYRRKASDEQAQSFGYKFAAIDYDETLRQYSDWLLSLKDENVTVIDLHGAMNDHIAIRREKLVSFTLSPDAVHPNITGHWLMAFLLLHTVGLDVDLLPTVTPSANPLAAKAWEETFVLPVTSPISPDVDLVAIQQEVALNSAIYGHLLTVPLADDDHPSQRFQLLADGEVCGEFTHNQIAEGINITAIPTFPTNRAGQKLWDAVRQRRRLEYHQFRAGTDKPLAGKPPAEDIPAKIKDLDAEIAKLREPMKVVIRLEP